MSSTWSPNGETFDKVSWQNRFLRVVSQFQYCPEASPEIFISIDHDKGLTLLIPILDCHSFLGRNKGNR